MDFTEFDSFFTLRFFRTLICSPDNISIHNISYYVITFNTPGTVTCIAHIISSYPHNNLRREVIVMWPPCRSEMRGSERLNDLGKVTRWGYEWSPGVPEAKRITSCLYLPFKKLVCMLCQLLSRV